MEIKNCLTINQIAEAKGWTYHTARNRIRKTPGAAVLGTRLGYVWAYPPEILDILGNEGADNSTEAQINRSLIKVWNGICRRVRRHPGYAGCSIAWKTKEEFIEWAKPLWKPGTCIDKDLLVPGNKVYGPHTCCFIPNELNVLIAKRPVIRRVLHYNRRLRECYRGCPDNVINAVETHWVFK